MQSFHAWRDGIRRVVSAPSRLWPYGRIATTLVSVPLTLLIRGDIERSLNGSVVATAAARGVDYEWMQEFADRATGVATTFRPTIIGFAAVLDNLSAYVDNVRRPTSIAAAALVYVLLWTFLTGGVIDRYQRRSTGDTPRRILSRVRALRLSVRSSRDRNGGRIRRALRRAPSLDVRQHLPASHRGRGDGADGFRDPRLASI